MKALAAILSGLAIGSAPGCSDDEDEPGRSLTVTPQETVRISADEYRFDPEHILVKAGGRVVRLRVVLDNRGSLAHNIRIRARGREVAGLQSFPAGEKRPLSANLRPGEYDFACTVADHEELGMAGTLEIR